MLGPDLPLCMIAVGKNPSAEQSPFPPARLNSVFPGQWGCWLYKDNVFFICPNLLATPGLAPYWKQTNRSILPLFKFINRLILKSKCKIASSYLVALHRILSVVRCVLDMESCAADKTWERRVYTGLAIAAIRACSKAH